MEDNKKGLTGVLLDEVNRIPPGLLRQYDGYLAGMLDGQHPEDPTPIQRQIERVVTNGTGYLEKGSKRFSSAAAYAFKEAGIELPTANDLAKARVAYERENAPLKRATWLGTDIEYLPNGEISLARGIKEAKKMTLAEEVIGALRGKAFPEDIKIEEVPLFPEYGPGIHSLTEGPGNHDAIYGKYDVPEGQVYATINTIGFMSGSVSTYQFLKILLGN